MTTDFKDSFQLEFSTAWERFESSYPVEERRALYRWVAEAPDENSFQARKKILLDLVVGAPG